VVAFFEKAAGSLNLERFLHVVQYEGSRVFWAVRRKMLSEGPVGESDVMLLKAKDKTMLPDYIIYDELKKERERRRKERPRIEIERPKRYWRESEFDGPHRDDDDESNRGVEIIKI
jgi:hypothetical protein